MTRARSVRTALLTATGFLAAVGVWLASMDGNGGGVVPANERTATADDALVSEVPQPATESISREDARAHDAAADSTPDDASNHARAGSGEVWIHAVWGDDGRAAAGIALEMRPGGEPGVRPRAGSERFLSDVAGTASARGVAPGPWVAFSDVGGRAAFEVVEGAVTRVRLEVPRGPALRGQVFGPEGRPAPGARIHLSRVMGFALDGAAFECDASGRFELDSIGEARFVAATKSGFGPSGLYALDRGAAGDEVRALRPLRLHLSAGGARVAGVVLDADGRRVAGARVKISQSPTTDSVEGWTVFRGMPAEIATDSGGDFAIDGAPHGVLTLDARAPGSGSVRIERSVEAGGTLRVELRLPAAASVRGVVRAPDGTPLEAVRIRIGGREVGRSDAEGEFRIEGIEPGSHVIEAEAGAAGHAGATLDFAAGVESRWEPVLGQRLSLRGRLLDELGAPLAGWAVFATWPDHPERPAQALETSLDGRFELTCLDEQPARVTVCRELHAPQPLLVRDGLVARRGAEETVIVVSQDLLPNSWIEVRFTGTDDSVLLVQRQVDDLREDVPEVPFVDGHARAGPLRAGRHHVWIRATDGVPSYVATLDLEAQAEVEIGPVEPVGLGAIEWTLGGPEAAPARLRLSLNDPAGLLVWSKEIDPTSATATRTVEGLPAGLYRFTALDPDTGRRDELELAVVAGEVVSATLALLPP